jgi:hypothetical protein
MLKTKLLVGESYILKGINDRPDTAEVVCAYEGDTDGQLQTADGATFWAGERVLRFRVCDPGGSVQIALYSTAGDVIEIVQTRRDRERREAEHAARIDAARAQALEFLAGLGVTDVYVPGGDARYAFDHDYQAGLMGGAQTADELKVSGLKIGDLRRIVAEARDQH